MVIVGPVVVLVTPPIIQPVMFAVVYGGNLYLIAKRKQGSCGVKSSLS